MVHDNRVVHETVLKDLIDTIYSAAKNNFLKNISGKRDKTINSTSITKAASNLVLTFPVIVDESVPINTAKILSRAIEKKATMLLQALFSALSANALKNNKTVFDMIHKVHTNLNSDDLEDYIQYLDALGDKSTNEAALKLIDSYRNIIQEENKIIDKYTLSSAIPAPLLEKVIINPQKMTATNKDNIDINVNRVGTSTINITKASDKSPNFKDQILNGDIKKANDMMPTMMVINFYVNNTEDGKQAIAGSAVIGVKAKLQYVPSKEMVERILIKNKDKNGLFNFIRSTTREISFFKDFLFAVDKAKIDAGSKASPIWKILERRAAKSKYNRWFGTQNDASAITSLVISTDTVKALREYDMNCNTREVLDIMDAYNLMAFFICDEIKERVISMYDDGSRQFEVLSYSMLEKDDKTDYKKIINLLASR